MNRTFFSLRFFRLFGLLLATSLMLPACDDDDDNGNNGGDASPETYQETETMLANYANNIIIPGFQDLKTELEDLDAQTQSFTADPDTAGLNSLRAQLKSSWLAWMEVNMFTFGPGMEQNLEMEMDIFPTKVASVEDNINKGIVDMSMVDNDMRGFPALDYLLNAKDAATTVADFGTDSLNTRGEYTRAVVQDLLGRIDATLAGWQDSYADTFSSNPSTDAGSPLSLFFNSYEKVYEVIRRDRVSTRCFATGDEDLVEAFYGEFSAELAKANVDAFHRIFNGTDQSGNNRKGLDDLLNFLDAQNANGEPLAQAIDDQFAVAQTAVNSLTDPLSDLCEQDAQSITDSETEMQKLIPLMKNDAVSALQIRITFQDSDGD